MDAGTSVQFIEVGSELTGVEVGRGARGPVVGRLHKALFALGVVISSYQVRTLPRGTVERMILERHDGGAITGELGELTRAAVLPIALDTTGI